MASASVLRGQLRPGLGRTPPFLLIGLILVILLLSFNYWNLSGQYNDLVQELSELQDQLRVVTLKRENAEKQVDTFRSLLRDSDNNLGKLKITLEEKTRLLDDVSLQIVKKNEALRDTEIKLSSVINVKNNSDKIFKDLKRNEDYLKNQNAMLSGKVEALSIQNVELKAQVSHLKHQFFIPPIVKQPGTKTVPGDKIVRGSEGISNIRNSSNAVQETTTVISTKKSTTANANLDHKIESTTDTNKQQVLKQQNESQSMDVVEKVNIQDDENVAGNIFEELEINSSDLPKTNLITINTADAQNTLLPSQKHNLSMSEAKTPYKSAVKFLLPNFHPTNASVPHRTDKISSNR